jgi:hypothetical protein
MPQCATKGCDNACKSIYCVDCAKKQKAPSSRCAECGKVVPVNKTQCETCEQENGSFQVSTKKRPPVVQQVCKTPGCGNTTRKLYCSDCSEAYQQQKESQPLQQCATPQCETMSVGKFCIPCKQAYLASMRKCEDCPQMTAGRYCFDCRTKFNKEPETQLCAGCQAPSKFKFCVTCRTAFKLKGKS